MLDVVFPITSVRSKHVLSLPFQIRTTASFSTVVLPFLSLVSACGGSRSRSCPSNFGGNENAFISAAAGAKAGGAANAAGAANTAVAANAGGAANAAGGAGGIQALPATSDIKMLSGGRLC